MWSNRVSNPGSFALESGALPTALRGPAIIFVADGLIGTKCNICSGKPRLFS